MTVEKRYVDDFEFTLHVVGPDDQKMWYWWLDRADDRETRSATVMARGVGRTERQALWDVTMAFERLARVISEVSERTD